jgi:hypothetical protein
VLQAAVSVWPDLSPDDLPLHDRSLAKIRSQPVNQAGVLSERLVTRVDVSLNGDSQSISLMSQLSEEDLVEEAITLLRISQTLKGDQPGNLADLTSSDLVVRMCASSNSMCMTPRRA